MYKIETPCHEDWNNMKPDNKGRFCAVCNKSVHDLTRKTQEEIGALYREADGNLCGRMAVRKLVLRLKRPAPENWRPGLWRVLSRVQRFALMLLVALGVLKFDPASGQVLAKDGKGHTVQQEETQPSTPDFLEFSLRSKNGKPLAGNTASLRRGNVVLRETVIGKDGRVFFDHVEPGEYEFVVRGEFGMKKLSEQVLVLGGDTLDSLDGGEANQRDSLTPTATRSSDDSFKQYPFFIPFYEYIDNRIYEGLTGVLSIAPKPDIFYGEFEYMGDFISTPLTESAEGYFLRSANQLPPLNMGFTYDNPLPYSAPLDPLRFLYLQKVPPTGAGGLPFNFDILPNPSSGFFRVTANGVGEKPVSIMIADAEAKILDHKTISPQRGVVAAFFDYSEKPTGIYTVSLSTGSGTLVRELNLRTLIPESDGTESLDDLISPFV